MARANLPTEPFPDHIDRDYFAAYLSGFTDGEGCFWLGFHKSRNGRLKPAIHFSIVLRADDLDILKLIQCFFGCGNLRHKKGQKRYGPNRQEMFGYSVARINDLVSTIIPHFDRHVLLAKKRHDFLVWKQAVSLAYRVHCQHRGRRLKWTKERIEEYQGLVQALKATRKYNAPTVPLPLLLSKERGLFDSLPD